MYDQLVNPGQALQVAPLGVGDQVEFHLYYDGVEKNSWVKKPVVNR